MDFELALGMLICVWLGMIWMRTIIYDEVKTGMLTLFGVKFIVKQYHPPEENK